MRNPANYDKLTRPVCAFITFESDDGFNEAINYSRKASWYSRNNSNDDFETEMLLNTTPRFKPAAEPTNIIWENRHIKVVNYGLRVTGALIITGVMMALSFAMIIAFK